MRSGNAPKGSEIDSRDAISSLRIERKKNFLLSKIAKISEIDLDLLRLIALVKSANQSDNCLKFHASIVLFSPPQWFLQRATTCLPKSDENRHKVSLSVVFGARHSRRGKALITHFRRKRAVKKRVTRSARGKRWRRWQRHVARRNDNAAAHTMVPRPR